MSIYDSVNISRFVYNEAMSDSSPQQSRGFTLVEQVIAGTVLLLMFIAVTQAFITIGTINNRANAQTQAIELMQQKLERIRNTPYANLAVGTTSFASELNAFPALQSPRTATVVVSETVAGTLKRVDITISYTQSGRLRTVATSTLIGLRGLNR